MAQQASLGAAGGPAAEPPRARTRDMSPAMRERALDEMSKNLLFSSIREAERMRIADSLFDVEVQAGEDVMQQGADGDNFYIIDHGVLEVFKQDVAGPVHAYDNAGSFGELALMYSKPRAASVTATQDGLLWAMDRKAFRNIVMKSSSATLTRTLRSVDVLKSLSVGQLQAYSSVLVRYTLRYSGKVPVR